MKNIEKYKIGQTFKVVYPFFRSVYIDVTKEKSSEMECWIPGTLSRNIYPDYSENVANAEGIMFLKIVGIYKPDGFPERIFYTRRYVDPDGFIFGKNKCHISAKSMFKRISYDYLYEYVVDKNHSINQIK